MYAARYMCQNWGQVDGPNMAPTGSVLITRPSASRSKPVGLFIQAFAAITKKAPAAPEMIIGKAVSMCARGDIRSQPNR